ncbi:MAG: hypothetical protein ACU83V_09475 [Gammaproteobacteria bacterium]
MHGPLLLLDFLDLLFGVRAVASEPDDTQKLGGRSNFENNMLANVDPRIITQESISGFEVHNPQIIGLRCGCFRQKGVLGLPGLELRFFFDKMGAAM